MAGIASGTVRRAFVCLGTALAVLLGAVGTANAQATVSEESTQRAKATSAMVEAIKGESPKVEGLPKERVDELLKEVSSPEKFVKSGYKIDKGGAFGEASEGGELVYFPLKGKSLVKPSKLALIFKDGKLQDTLEMVFKSKTKNSGQVKVWANGKLVSDKVVTDSDAPKAFKGGQEAQVSKGEEAPIQAMGMNWGKLNDCLSAMGIPAWVVAGISTVCAVVCLGTLGAGCAACIAASAGVSAGTVSHCVRKAWD